MVKSGIDYIMALGSEDALHEMITIGRCIAGTRGVGAWADAADLDGAPNAAAQAEFAPGMLTNNAGASPRPKLTIPFRRNCVAQ